MRFTAITLLALGASASAYVVNDKKVETDNAVEARVVGSGPVRAAALVAAMQAREPEPEPFVEIEARHHKGKGKAKGKKATARFVKSDEDDEVTKREPHHKGKGLGALAALAKGKGKKATARSVEARQEFDQAADDAHWADLHTRDAEFNAEFDIETREPHHKGKGLGALAALAKGKGKKATARSVEARQEFDQAADDAHWADLHTRDAEFDAEFDIETREPHHKGKGLGALAALGKGKGKKATARSVDSRSVVDARSVDARSVHARSVHARSVDARSIDARQEFDQAADDAHWADLHTRDAEFDAEFDIETREPHHKGKGLGALAALGKGKGKKTKRDVEARQEFDQAADDAHWADLHTRDAEFDAEFDIETREPHHKGKGLGALAALGKGKGKANN
ncbi:uncharacterized protein M421DRAFT_91363 [Didymella exigua CBS 183.55]|uniref:Uncharacterized protein n=1 Tax=Didymella exigua CBS 183.55 TaxID=1150837 RepID=A0A6A5RY80_9PLEO|nr:uncharacterized protein M421DRAFT_91363 [Didymella exigua CBS 183.55]KAF1930207.1 hypothetical protein M421DRAFT_91363 [Didymella exigua CBS 183.55]